MTIQSRLFIAALLLGGCAPKHDSNVAASDEALSSTLDLISPATCTQLGGKLQRCQVATTTFTLTPFETAVPLRTSVTSMRQGTCSTQYPLQVSLKADQEPAVNFSYIAGGQIKVKRGDHGIINQLGVSDSSPWTKFAAFDPSCRISLSVTPNEPDVDTKADAQAVIDALTKDVAAKQSARDRARELDLYSKAFAFMRSLADNFLGQLTNEQLQDLRAAALDAQPSLELLITSCNSLSQDDRSNLLRLDLGLATLGHPEDWKNPDGSNKTLKDFLGPADQQVIATIDSLAQSSTADGGAPPDYDTLYKQAEADYQAALHKLDLAKQQLATFLN